MRNLRRNFGLGIGVAAAFFCAHSAGHAAQNSGEVEISREAKAAIQMGQQWLAGLQRADGSFAGDNGQGAGIVGAGVLAWLVTGNLPGEGPYGKHIARGIDYILSQAQPSGMLGKGAAAGMYQHGLATICLAEAWGQTQDKRIYDKLKKAIELIVRTQNDKGGWRYEPKSNCGDDLSVTVFELLALRAAKDAGIAVPKETIDRAINYVLTCKTPKDNDGLSGFSYTPGGQKTFAMTSAGTMSLILCGYYKAGQLKDGLDFIVKAREKKEDAGNHFVYGHYYAAQAMYQAGAQGERFKEYWMKWYPDISKTIISKQEKSGPNRGMLSREYGVWGHSMCLLTLAIPYRYLPIYQR